MWVVLKLRDNMSYKQAQSLLHWHTEKIAQAFPEYGKMKLKHVPSKHPPPVKVKGPFAPGDERGLTFQADSQEDAEAFV